MESRSTAWVHKPYKQEQGAVDGPHNGPAPGPWQVEVHPDETFLTHTKKVDVPHTAYVKVQCLK